MTSAKKIVALSCALLSFAAPSFAGGTAYKDTDWNTTFIDNCGLHRDASIRNIKVGGDKKLRVTLQDGDIGKCSTDNQARHRAPYWERAEVSQQSSLRTGQSYRISTEITFVEGFTGERETFFQIHGWASDCRQAYPPVMMKFKRGQLAVETLRGVSAFSSGRHRNALKKKVSVKSLYGKPVQMLVDFDLTSKPARLSVSLAGRKVITDAPVDYAACAIPHVKFGIYRPGGKGSGTSAVLFDDVRVIPAR
jgi:hypothetical protein